MTAGPLKGRKGVRLADILDAIEARNAGRVSSPEDMALDFEADTWDSDDDHLSGPLSGHESTVVLGRLPVAGNGFSGSGDGDE